MSNMFSGAGGCMERAGFLFPHVCDNLATNVCSMCTKPICVEHTVWRTGTMTCTSCARTMGAETTHASTDSGSTGDSTLDDPYFYREHHMKDWDDKGDFTEGEQGALFEGDEADLAGFEDDMGAS